MKERATTYYRAKKYVGSEPKMEERFMKVPVLKKMAERMREDWVSKHKAFANQERASLRRLYDSKKKRKVL